MHDTQPSTEGTNEVQPLVPPMPENPPQCARPKASTDSQQTTFGERFIARIGPDLAFQLMMALVFALVATVVTVLILNGALQRMERSTWVDAVAHIPDSVTVLTSILT